MTNGRHWRLYWQGARSRSEDFLEIDIALVLGMPGLKPPPGSLEAENNEHFLKVFYLLFRRAAFLPQSDDPEQRHFHQIALDEGRHWQAIVSQDLGDTVFNQVFPTLVKALVQHEPQAPQPLSSDYLETVRRAALILLYRLLFLFYAEDRNLLPVHDIRYARYALRKIRHDIAQSIDKGEPFSTGAKRYYMNLQDFYRAIDQGDTSIGLPPCGLFDELPLLERTLLPDAPFAISFLDHHLRCGDSLFGEWVNVVSKELHQMGALFMQNALAGMSAATQMMNDISELTDADIAEVKQSKYLFESVDKTLKPLIQLLDFWQALRWFSPLNGSPQTVHPGLAPLLSGRFGDVMTVVSKGQATSDKPKDKKDVKAINDLLAQTRAIAERERFLHWEVAFPTVWRHLERSVGGFDIVMSNPPWERVKLQ
ncbi:MAG: hypothetical protein ABFS56_13735 [Pseudomonadota bacterium]